MFQNANSLNSLLKYGIKDAQRDMSRKGGKIEFFDTYKFFEELYLNPQRYFNGSAPVNVTGHCHQCPNATDWRYCGVYVNFISHRKIYARKKADSYSGDCAWEERDSYMWWDELHPSEQTGRLLAKELVKKLEGNSLY